MGTELTDIQKWTKMYQNPKNEEEFYLALKRLSVVHKKYGTIDISIIKSLIN
jgi:hypothetical protein